MNQQYFDANGSAPILVFGYGPYVTLKQHQTLKAERDSLVRLLDEFKTLAELRALYIDKLMNISGQQVIEIKRLTSQRNALAVEVDEANERVAEVTAERDALAADKEKLIRLLSEKARFHLSVNVAEIQAKAIEEAATYLSESIPDDSHESVIFKDRHVYISTRYLRTHAAKVRQGGAA